MQTAGRDFRAIAQTVQVYDLSERLEVLLWPGLEGLMGGLPCGPPRNTDRESLFGSGLKMGDFMNLLYCSAIIG